MADLTDPHTAGIIAREAADKAERSIRRGALHPATVVTFNPPDEFGPATAIVHMDGDLSDENQPVKVACGELLPGQRCVCEYNPPHQAVAIAPIGLVKVPSFRLTDECGGGEG